MAVLFDSLQPGAVLFLSPKDTLRRSLQAKAEATTPSSKYPRARTEFSSEFSPSSEQSTEERRMSKCPHARVERKHPYTGTEFNPWSVQSTVERRRSEHPHERMDVEVNPSSVHSTEERRMSKHPRVRTEYSPSSVHSIEKRRRSGREPQDSSELRESSDTDQVEKEFSPHKRKRSEFLSPQCTASPDTSDTTRRKRRATARWDQNRWQSQRHRSESRQHWSEPRRHRSVSRQHRSEPRRHRSKSRQHRSEPRQHRSVSWQHRSEPRRHRSVSRQHRSKPRRYRSVSRQHRSEPWRHRSEPRRHRHSLSLQPEPVPTCARTSEWVWSSREKCISTAVGSQATTSEFNGAKVLSPRLSSTPGIRPEPLAPSADHTSFYSHAPFVDHTPTGLQGDIAQEQCDETLVSFPGRDEMIGEPGNEASETRPCLSVCSGLEKQSGRPSPASHTQHPLEVTQRPPTEQISAPRTEPLLASTHGPPTEIISTPHSAPAQGPPAEQISSTSSPDGGRELNHTHIERQRQPNAVEPTCVAVATMLHKRKKRSKQGRKRPRHGRRKRQELDPTIISPDPAHISPKSTHNPLDPAHIFQEPAHTFSNHFHISPDSAYTSLDSSFQTEPTITSSWQRSAPMTTTRLQANMQITSNHVPRTATVGDVMRLSRALCECPICTCKITQPHSKTGGRSLQPEPKSPFDRDVRFPGVHASRPLSPVEIVSDSEDDPDPSPDPSPVRRHLAALPGLYLLTRRRAVWSGRRPSEVVGLLPHVGSAPSRYHAETNSSLAGPEKPLGLDPSLLGAGAVGGAKAAKPLSPHPRTASPLVVGAAESARPSSSQTAETGSLTHASDQHRLTFVASGSAVQITRPSSLQTSGLTVEAARGSHRDWCRLARAASDKCDRACLDTRVSRDTETDSDCVLMRVTLASTARGCWRGKRTLSPGVNARTSFVSRLRVPSSCDGGGHDRLVWGTRRKSRTKDSPLTSVVVRSVFASLRPVSTKPDHPSCTRPDHAPCTGSNHTPSTAPTSNAVPCPSPPLLVEDLRFNEGIVVEGSEGGSEGDVICHAPLTPNPTHPRRSVLALSAADLATLGPGRWLNDQVNPDPLFQTPSLIQTLSLTQNSSPRPFPSVPLPRPLPQSLPSLPLPRPLPLCLPLSFLDPP